MKGLKLSAGFTLIEIISVMVVLSVIASFSTSFIISTMRIFVSVNSKNSLLAESILATEYMVQRLRNALPYSTRLSNDGSCLQFMPIVSSGLYVDILPSVINGDFPFGSIIPIQASAFIVSGGDSDYLAIAANSTDELFGFFPGSIAAISSITTNSITLVSDKQWLRNSITQRFYIVEAPSAFCLVDNELRLYRKLSIEDDMVNVTDTYDLLSTSASALGQAFSISSAVGDRNTRVTLSLLFSRDDNRLEYSKQVVVPNVP
jgi:MSHA biogenesis protein MshO